MIVPYRETGMNGIISKRLKRSLNHAPKLATQATLGVCLFAGFVFGMNVDPKLVPKISYFKNQEISFKKISWITAEKKEDFKISKIENGEAPFDLIFKPFEIKWVSKKKSLSRIHHSKFSNLAKLTKIFKNLREANIDVFSDYENASVRWRDDFSYSALGIAPIKLIPVQVAVVEIEPTKLKSANLNRPRLQKHFKTSVVYHSSAEYKKSNTSSTPYRHESDVKTVMDSQSLSIRKPVASHSPPESIVSTKSSAQQIEIEGDGVRQDIPENQATSNLTHEEKVKLTNSLINSQLISQNLKKSVPSISPESKNTSGAPQINLADSEKLPEDPVAYNYNIVSKISADPCLANRHIFLRPTGTAEMTIENSQINPEHIEWITKDMQCAGWIRATHPDFIPTLTLEPAPNSGGTLMLDQNSLALIGIKSGIHIAKGTGTVLGILPENFKVDFVGRAEDTEYFESNGKKFFAILNVEPGAGVLELRPSTNQNLGTTVFTPVFEDTITYLDLAPPTPQNLSIKVMKSGYKNDLEVAGLSVGISTQSGIQAITQSNGQATLKNVNLVHGFPVFIDVSSKHNQVQGYTYRYELKNKRKSGSYQVNQVSEKSMSNWFKQVKQGLSDQSAMVVGSYQRKGFRNFYYAKVEPLTAKYGMEPINYTLLNNGKLSESDPLEGDLPRFMSVQVPEGLSQIKLIDDSHQIIQSTLFPISPRIIHVVSE